MPNHLLPRASTSRRLVLEGLQCGKLEGIITIFSSTLLGALLDFDHYCTKLLQCSLIEPPPTRALVQSSFGTPCAHEQKRGGSVLSVTQPETTTETTGSTGLPWPRFPRSNAPLSGAEFDTQSMHPGGCLLTHDSRALVPSSGKHPHISG